MLAFFFFKMCALSEQTNYIYFILLSLVVCNGDDGACLKAD